VSFRARQPGCPCCDDDCRITISGWNQVAGTWTITGDNLETASSSALAVTTNAHPDGLSTHYVTVKVEGDTDGDVLRVVVAYTDVNNYLYAELEVGTTDGTLRLFQRTGGSTFQLGDDVTVTGAKSGESHDMTVCYDGEVLTAIVNSTTSYAQLITATGTYVGVATGAITTLATFNTFKWYIHYDDGGDYYGEPNNCPSCTRYVIGCDDCEDKKNTVYVKVAIQGFVDRSPPKNSCDCDRVNGVHILTLLGFCSHNKSLQFPSLCSGGDYTDSIQFSVWPSFLRLMVRINTSEGQDDHIFEAARESLADCTNHDEVDLLENSPFPTVLTCDSTTATVKVTSL
jgi:hypothetical protein